MSECRFCNGEFIEPGSVGDGLPTISMAIDRLSEAFGFAPKKPTRCSLGIQLQNGNRLCWDNSAREYAQIGRAHV